MLGEHILTYAGVNNGPQVITLFLRVSCGPSANIESAFISFKMRIEDISLVDLQMTKTNFYSKQAEMVE